MTVDTSLNTFDLAIAAKSRAKLYRFVALHFNRLMDAQFVSQMRDPDFSAMLNAIGDGADNEDLLTIGAVLMAVFIEKTRATDVNTLANQLGADRTRLYRGVSSAYGLQPPYEALWTRNAGSSDLLQELNTIYRHAGVELDAQRPERLDYVGVELDFMQVLANREAACWETGDEIAATSLFGAQRQFFSKHLLNWVPVFTAKALDAAQTDFYRAHLRMLAGLLETERAMLA